MASAAISVVMSQLTAHTGRLQDAANENTALDLLIPAFDLDVKAICAAWNQGTATLAQCVAAAQAVDSNCYTYLRAQVGKPGTAWNTPANLGDVTCAANTCTAGCCVYYSDLHPAIYGASEFASGKVGLIPVLQGSGGSGGDNEVYVPEVYPPPNTAYGNYSRPSYTITLTFPQPKPTVATQALAVSGTGINQTVKIQAPTTVATTVQPVKVAAAAPTSPTPTVAATVATQTSTLTSIFSALSNTELATIVGVVGGIILIVAYLFGSNAVRVNK